MLSRLKAKVSLHRFEVPVGMQQAITVLDTECFDNQVHGLSNCNPTVAQRPIIRRSADSHDVIQHRYDRKPSKITFKPQGMSRTLGALENLQ